MAGKAGKAAPVSKKKEDDIPLVTVKKVPEAKPGSTSAAAKPLAASPSPSFYSQVCSMASICEALAQLSL